MAGSIIRRMTGPVAAFALSAVLLIAAVLLTLSAQHAARFGGYYSWLIVINLAGVIVLGALIVLNVWRLVSQFRHNVLGSRLNLRFLATFVLLTLLPLATVYYFAVQFLNRGIDSWYNVRIERALDDALLLGRRALEATRQDVLDKVHNAADRLGNASNEPLTDVIQLLDAVREQYEFAELSLFSQSGRIIASSTADPRSLVPDAPDDTVLTEVRQGNVYSGLEPMSAGGLQLRVAVPVQPNNVNEPMQVLQVLQPLPLRYSRLGTRIQEASTEYERLLYLRQPLKFSFILTLTLIMLVTTLIAIWLAILSSRRMVAPLRRLAEGTRAVAQGNYRTQLPVTSADELGVLVRSFNEMTRQIHLAQRHARHSQAQAEAQRTHLQTVLAHLSSGVVSFDRDAHLQTSNAAAAQILQIDIRRADGRAMGEIIAEFPWTEPLFSAIDSHLRQGVHEWQAEILLAGEARRQILLCRGTLLPGDGHANGCVAVFDDVTELIQAQRNAAWGEVARRLAHEIKNPLTPIQLSAERIRRKYLSRLPPDDRETLDRATRTIAQQVESMKTMVNAFSAYAQPTRMAPVLLDLNQLVRDVVELHRREDHPLTFSLALANNLPALTADPARLRQVLNNLIINARQALTATTDPCLGITTRSLTLSNETAIELDVNDNGPGFPEPLLDRVFEPYVTNKIKGTGLGLAIVKQIVDEHGGTIRAANHHGARVTIRLPVGARRSTLAASTDSPLAAARQEVVH